MKTLIIISWRNIWRNPKRSLIMITAIILGLWAGIFVSSIMFGLVQARFETSIEQQFSNIQLHNPEFIKDDNLNNNIPRWKIIESQLTANKHIKSFTGRTIINGMLATANLTSGVNIIGIDPQAEAKTTNLASNIIDGHYFSEGLRNPILIGRGLAEKNKLQTRSRVVLTFQNQEGELISASFRVAGIYQTANSVLDQKNVYVLQSDIKTHLRYQIIVNEIAILVNDLAQLNHVKNKIEVDHPDLKVRTWIDISPELGFLQEYGNTMLVFILGIILFALGFGLVNTMLMSVFERTPELGMLMAVGMNRRRVFGMVIIETTFLTFLGAIGGIVLGYATNALFGSTGLDLAVVGGDSLNDFGYPSLIFPNMTLSMYATLTVLVMVMVFFSSIFPALKAIRLKPAEAIRQ